MAPPKSIINNNGLIRIRFTHGGVRYNLSRLGSTSDLVAMRYAQGLIDRISLDISNGSFSCKSTEELMLRYNASNIPSEDKKKNTSSKTQGEGLVKTSLLLLGRSEGSIEKAVCSHLISYGAEISTLEDAILFIRWLKEEKGLASSSISRYVDMLRTVAELFKQVHVEIESKPNPQAFTRDEVKTICDWFKECSYFKGGLYYGYVKFLFLTGCRISEAIGLRWRHINFSQSTIHFYETLARDKDNSTRRVVKTTKKNIMRHFPINDSLLTLLLEIKEGSSEDLVFTIEGKPVEDRNFRGTYWTRCLRECNIEYRKPSTTRHTFISHYLEQTKDVVKCAALTHGSKSGVQTIFEHYASLVNKVEVPNLYD